MNNLFQYTPIGNNLGLGNTRNYVPMSQFTQQPIKHQHSTYETTSTTTSTSTTTFTYETTSTSTFTFTYETTSTSTDNIL